MAFKGTSIKLSEFSSMSDKQRKSRVDALFESAIKPTSNQVNEWVEQVHQEIRQYEFKYKMSSEDMVKSLNTAKVLAIPDICSWLMLLKSRGQIEQKYGGSRSK